MPTGKTPVPGPLSRHIAVTISSEMRRRGLRQTDIAAEAGMSPSQLSRALSASKVFTVDQLAAVCRAVGLSLSEVVAQASTETVPGAGDIANVTEIRVRPPREDGRAVAKMPEGDRGGDHGDG
ncbi:helix-turn-helix domain-containing protein [Microbacterium oleivorans]|uniref:Helix-turn-helix transcriptional regulator n=1 Tax=Microbacterium oleivorans TaxID=273677 RepID=A0A7D5IW33_9MICO|nr:helix-turn-helix transcriptional regulator [Microbacterium oleivorans]QLD10856.1 helix-turn-helix transcriptional regulator [Microbacterium oleivorans]